jgi:hypothetical protein
MPIPSTSWETDPKTQAPHDVTDRTVLGSYRVDSPSLVCAKSTDVDSGLEVGAFVGALGQNLASAAGPDNPGLLAGRRPVS